jgi:hypothetical protein
MEKSCGYQGEESLRSWSDSMASEWNDWYWRSQARFLRWKEAGSCTTALRATIAFAYSHKGMIMKPECE